MVALPEPIPVTKPVLLTVATSKSLECHVTAWLAPPGDTAAVICSVPPIAIVGALGETVTDATGVAGARVIVGAVLATVQFKVAWMMSRLPPLGSGPSISTLGKLKVYALPRLSVTGNSTANLVRLICSFQMLYALADQASVIVPVMAASVS